MAENTTKEVKRMDERKVAKEALKKENLKEIAHQLAVNNKIKEDDIYVNDKGRMILDIDSSDIDAMRRMIIELADELAEAKAELWLQKQSTEISKNPTT
jgi:ribose 5-phosphate isomerase